MTNQEAFAELAKLPFLFQHYSETAANENFISFIKEHYFENERQNDDHEHGKLPFRHSEDGCTHHPFPSALKELKSENQMKLQTEISGTSTYTVTDEKNFPAYHGHIWQPPKLLI